MIDRDIINCSLVYSANMLRMLFSMNLLTEKEYQRIISITEEHYNAEIYV